MDSTEHPREQSAPPVGAVGDTVERKRLHTHRIEGVWARERQITGLKFRPVSIQDD